MNFRITLRWMTLLLAAAAIFSSACAAMRDPMPLVDVLTMSKQGDTPDSIGEAIRASRTSYALRGSDFGKLAAAGVPREVLDEIQQGFANDVDLIVRYWSGGESMGRCIPCYPQQVDLAGLATGGVTQTPPPLRSPPGRPLGLPDWFHMQSFTSRSITVEAVRQMAKSGQSEAQIIDALRHSRLREAFGSRGALKLGTKLPAGVSGSKLADLRAEGVPDAVLDELQESWLAAYVEFLRIRYQDVGKGSRP
ncbi:MAG: hypothetical protein ABI794_06930 [Betaproteobacteria bacterium]